MQHGPAIPWRDTTTRSTLYKVAYHQSVSKYVPAAFGTKGPNGSVLVDESEPQDSGIAGVIEFERTFAHVPATRYEYEDYIFQFQRFTDGEVIEFPIKVTATLRLDYFNTVSPQNIPLLQAFRMIKIGGGVYWSGGRVPPEGVQPWVIAEDSTLRRWRGNIYERMTRYVRGRSVAVLPGSE